MQPGGAATGAAVESEEERNRRLTLLLDGLDLINQGVSVFDSNLKVVAANRSLLTMFGFPQELARPGTDFAEFIRYNAERGEYGPGDPKQQVEERVQLALEFKPHHFERTRPDGTVLTITGVPISHGGWVTIYTDVTELRTHERQLEEQVRAHTLELEDANTRLRQANEELMRANKEQMRLEAALVHAQRMEAVGELTGGLAHNFNNLLTVVINNLMALRDKAGADSGADSGPAPLEAIEPALAAALKGADITRGLLAFARRQALEPSIVEVNRVIANLLARHAMPDMIHVSTETSDDELFTRVDAKQLEHALVNLVLNARDAMAGGGSLVIRSSQRQLNHADAASLEVTPRTYVELRVADTGAGMDEATRSRVFEPFFTTKPDKSGTGLGLSMVYGFVRQSGGAVDISSAPGAGTVVTLLLPLCPPPAHGAAPLPGRRESGGHLVLLVDDNAEVRAVLRRQLDEIGHEVIEAPNGEEALAIIDRVPELAVLVSDVIMPGAMDGRRLAALARQRRPELRVVLVTGYAEGLDEAADRPFTLLRKPCTKEELVAAIAAPPRP
jgi:signal transduction histidine kinase